MSKTSDLHSIQEDFNNFYLNLRAEVLVSELLENTHLTEEDIIVLAKSTFSRGFRRDLMDSKINSNDKFEINISRNGIYDALPQGVFHKSVGIDTNLTYGEIRQKNKKEEKDARMLFAPIENEFFLQRVYLEQEEKNTIFELNNSLENSFAIDFWGIKEKVPKEYIFEFTKVLPYAHKVSKSESLIAQCLEQILNEKVLIKKTFKSLENPSKKNSKNDILGLNSSLLVEKTNVLYPFYFITIEISSLKNRYRYQENAIGNQLISVFCEYFVPLEIEYEINITFNQKESNFALNNESTVLGLSATI